MGGGQKTLTQLIKSLFADGTQGLYLNPQDALSVSDLSSIKDLSGNNNHAVQADSAKRASLITDPSGYKSLKFDGIDDGYATQSINFTATDKVTVIAAVRKLSDSSTGVVAELNTSSLNNSFAMFAPFDSGSAGYGMTGSGSSNRRITISTGPTSPNSAVLRGTVDIEANTVNLFQNSAQVGLSTGSTGTGKLGNYPLYIGRRGGFTYPFNGQIYALLVIGKLLDDATTAKIEKEFAKYIGVAL